MGQDASGINDDASYVRVAGRVMHRTDWSGLLAPDTESSLAVAAAEISQTPAEAPVPPSFAAAYLLPAAPEPPRAPTAAIASSHAPVAADPTNASAGAGAYPAMYVFGDSLSDVGNLYANDGGSAPQAPYYNGTFSNGPLWIDDYAASLGMAAPTPSLLGGNDFAYAGAQTGAPDLVSTTGHDLTEQVAEFVNQVPNPVAGALYVLDIGVNDLTRIINAGGSTATMQAEVNASVQTEVNIIGALAGRGGTDFMVLNVPDIGQTPLENLGGPQQAAEATSLASYYNTQLDAMLIPAAIGDHINLDIVDIFSLVDQITANPGAYGFTNVTDPVWTGTGQGMDTGTLAATTPAAQDQYFFWDTLHPTAAGQAWIAATAENVAFG